MNESNINAPEWEISKRRYSAFWGTDLEEAHKYALKAALADMIPLEAIQPPQSLAMVFPGLEIRLHQRRVLKDGTDIYLTRLECFLRPKPSRILHRNKMR